MTTVGASGPAVDACEQRINFARLMTRDCSNEMQHFGPGSGCRLIREGAYDYWLALDDTGSNAIRFYSPGADALVRTVVVP